MTDQKKYKYQIFIPVPTWQGDIINVIVETEKAVSAEVVKQCVVECAENEKNKDEKDLYNECLTVLNQYLTAIKKEDITKDGHGCVIGSTPYGKIYVDKWAI